MKACNAELHNKDLEKYLNKKDKTVQNLPQVSWMRILRLMKYKC